MVGVFGSALDLFSSYLFIYLYLSVRTFSVRVCRFSSYVACMTCEVPQGSLPGSLLFSFYQLLLARINLFMAFHIISE